MVIKELIKMAYNATFVRGLAILRTTAGLETKFLTRKLIMLLKRK